jgi:hypothetical protein
MISPFHKLTIPIIFYNKFKFRIAIIFDGYVFELILNRNIELRGIFLLLLDVGKERKRFLKGDS